MPIEIDILPEYQTWFMLHEVDTGITRAVETELRPLGISPIAMGVLFLLKSSKEPVSLTELSRWLFRQPHTVSELIARMEKQGLVSKKSSRKKGTVRVSLSRKGNDILRRYWKEMQAVRRIVSCLSEEENRNLMGYLYKLRQKALDELVLSTHKPFPWGMLPSE
jgi:DNA-binding MarR family transcriptional regulator